MIVDRSIVIIESAKSDDQKGEASLRLTWLDGEGASKGTTDYGMDAVKRVLAGEAAMTIEDVVRAIVLACVDDKGNFDSKLFTAMQNAKIEVATTVTVM